MNVSCPECRSVFRVDPAKVPSTIVRARCSVCGGVITVSAGSSIEDEFSSKPTTAASSNRTAPGAAATFAQRGNAGLAAALLDTLPATPRVTHASMPLPGPAAALAPPPSSGPPKSANAESTPAAKPQVQVSAPAASGRPVLFPPRPMMPGSASSAGPAARPIIAPRPSGAVGSAASVAPASSASQGARQSGGFAAPAPTNPASVVSAPPPAAASRPAPSSVPSGAAPTGARTPINPFLANDPHAKAKRLARALVSDLVTYFPQKRQDGLRDGTLKQLFKDEIQKSYEEYVTQVGREFAETTPHFQEALNDLLAGGQKVF